MKERKVNTDRVSAVLVLIFSGIFLWQLRYVHSPLDVIFPRTILIGMMALSILLFVRSFLRKPDPESIKNLFGAENRGKVLMGILGTLLWLLLIPYMGFATTSVVALIAFSIALGKGSDRTPKRLLSTVIVASVIVFLIYCFFSEFMEVQLPKGVLF